MGAENQVRPPIEGNVVELTVTGTASAAQDLGIERANGEGYFTFQADGGAMHILFGDAAVSAPDPTALGTATGVCGAIPADQERNYWISSQSQFFRVIGAGQLRYWKS